MSSRGGGARLMLGFRGREPDETFVRVLRESGARAAILFARNLVDARQTRELVAAIRGLVSWPLLIAIDQEGGAVVRLRRGITVFPGNMALAASGRVDLAARQGQESGRQLAALGIDLNLAPVVDLQTNPRNPGIGIRSFGDDPERALALARALIAGHREAGVACCLKHFPGKGAASVDAHYELPVLDRSLEEFRVPHLWVFEQLISDAEVIMSTHLVVRGLDAHNPATLSRAVVSDLLRGELGFDGLTISDDLEMGAIARHRPVPEAALLAARAGHDLLPICHDPERQLEAARVLDEALREGELDQGAHEASLERIEGLAARSRPGPLRDPRPGDALAREIAAGSVHLFGDKRGLLPLGTAEDLLILVPCPAEALGVEEQEDWAGSIRGCFRSEFPSAELLDFATDLGPQESSILLDRALEHERVLLLSWNAGREQGMRFLLEAACRTLAGRLIVAHLRNPFDQALVDPEVTALTAFGYRVVQLHALAAVLRGKNRPSGQLPASVT
ncbi:MAG: beta-N-acetylhexosaminidase [Planctomycetota bacterium]